MLTPQQRETLAAAMLEDVLAALAEAPLDGIMVNTLDPVATELARRYGARVVTDDARERPHRRGNSDGADSGSGGARHADAAGRYSARHGSGGRGGD